MRKLILTMTIALAAACSSAFAQTTDFTYQGQLQNSGSPANGIFDFEFLLFDSLAAGAQSGSTLARSSVAVANGVFSVKLDFGAQFPGTNRFLEIRVKQTGGGAFTPLAPRQVITSSPYSVKSLNTDQLGGVAASQYVLASGASIINATIQYNLGGNRILSAVGSGNIFAGINAGFSNSTGRSNSFFGTDAGFSNTEGINNSFVGSLAGRMNIAGSNNSFVGTAAGLSNTSGSNNAFFGFQAGGTNTLGGNNSFFGFLAGNSNSTGGNNSFFGENVGQRNTEGTYNSFFGASAGFANTTSNNNSFFGAGAGSNTTGNSNSFFGTSAGRENREGNSNSFFGWDAGFLNRTGSNNTIIGYLANLGSTDLTNATALGAGAIVSQSNTLVLGNNVKVGIGTTVPTYKLEIVDSSNKGLRVQTNITGGTVASFASNGDFQIDAPSIGGGRFTVLENGNVGIGINAPQSRLDVRGTTNKIIRTESSSTIGTWINLTNTAGGRSWNVISSGSGNGEGAGKLMFFDETSFATRMSIDELGNVVINVLGSAGSTALCRNASNQISTCSSSARYKNNINAFSSGLDLIRKLRPVSFLWKDGGMADMGFVAEEVAKVEPLLTTTNAKGEVEGVKYDRIGVVLVNAVNEQQAEIEVLRKQVAALKSLLCSKNEKAKICRE